MNKLITIIISWAVIAALSFVCIKGYMHYSSELNEINEKLSNYEREIEVYKEYQKELNKINEKKIKAYKKYNSKSGVALANDINSIMLSFNKYQERNAKSANTKED